MLLRSIACLAALTATTTAQVIIGIDDLLPNTGTSNNFPFNTLTGQTSLHVYKATTLSAGGICAGSVLTDLAVSPSSGTSGTYNAPTAQVQIGHLSVNPPVPGAWGTHLDTPITVHSLAAGPYSFPWTLNTHAPLPGFAAAGFVWDGVRDVGIQITTSTGVTGGFAARRTATQLRHYVAVFNAVAQLPTSNGLFAMEVKMTWTAGINCASRTTFGTGCYAGTTTFYENFASLIAVDLGGGPATEQVYRATSAGAAGYSVATQPSAWYAPTGTQVLNNAAVPAAMGDDTFSGPLNLPFTFNYPGGSTSVVHAASNGYIQLSATTSNASDFSPTVAELLSQPARLCPAWGDLHASINVVPNPASGVYFDVDPSNTAVYITWLDVSTFGAAAGVVHVNIQAVLYANGDFEYRYGTITPPATGPSAFIVGWSKGNAGGSNANDPGSIDLSAAVPFLTAGPDNSPLTLNSTLPTVGTNWTFTTTGIDAPSLGGITMIASASINPGVDLGFLGGAGCNLHLLPDIGSVVFPAAGGTGSFSLPIPAGPAFVGVVLHAQSIAPTTVNVLGFETSGGLTGTVGN